MLVVMQEGASEAQTEAVIHRLVEMGFNVHRSTGVRHTVLGGVGPMDDFDPAVLEVLEGVLPEAIISFLVVLPLINRLTSASAPGGMVRAGS